MKRINNLHKQVYLLLNILLADERARKNKTKSYGVIKHDTNKIEEDTKLSESLKNLTYKTSEYKIFKIYEPKERIIYRLNYYPDRIAHHALMNILEPIWIKIFTKDTYSCIKGRGIHLLAKNLKRDLRKDIEGTKYCLKLDIKKFYPSINHDILKKIIRRKIKDKKILAILDEIIDSAEGVPIGNYLSLFFANLYLAYFDHWIKEVLKAKYYYRYADDIVLLSNSKTRLYSWLLAINMYLENELKLKIKDNYLIFPVESRGIDFVGYVFYHSYTKIRKSIKKNLFKAIHKLENIDKSITSYFGWLKHCNSKNLLLKIEKETGLKFSCWNGKRTNISKFRNKKIKIIHVEYRKRYFIILFIYNNKSYEVKSTNGRLFYYLYGRKLPIKCHV